MLLRTIKANVILSSLVTLACAGVPYGPAGHGYGVAPSALLAAPAVSKVAAVPVDYPHVATPYEFGYKVHSEDGSTTNRQETSPDGFAKKGSYGYTGPDGIYRQVDYIADHNGFRAAIRTNEPGTDNQNAAATAILVEPSPYKVAPVIQKVAPVIQVAKAATYKAPVYAHAPNGGRKYSTGQYSYYR